MSMNDLETELAARAVAGDRMAYDRLLVRCQRQLYDRIRVKMPAVLRGVVSVEDILQDTFVEGWRSLGGYRSQGEGSFGRWLSTVADHRLLDAAKAQRAAKRDRRRTAAPPDDKAELIDFLSRVTVYERTPSQSAAGHEAAHAIQRALLALKAEYREVLQLRYIEGLPVADTAERMGRSEWAVHKLCARALQRLRDAVGSPSRFFSDS
jgi:RNA polymerase sigma-70 factor (ECF subfamily)